MVTYAARSCTWRSYSLLLNHASSVSIHWNNYFHLSHDYSKSGLNLRNIQSDKRGHEIKTVACLPHQVSKRIDGSNVYTGNELDTDDREYISSCHIQRIISNGGGLWLGHHGEHADDNLLACLLFHHGQEINLSIDIVG